MAGSLSHVLARWTWVWVNSGSWWWTGRPDMLRFMGSQESDTTERLNWTELSIFISLTGYIVSFRLRFTLMLGTKKYETIKKARYTPIHTHTDIYHLSPIARLTFLQSWDLYSRNHGASSSLSSPQLPLIYSYMHLYLH